MRCAWHALASHHIHISCLMLQRAVERQHPPVLDKCIPSPPPSSLFSLLPSTIYVAYISHLKHENPLGCTCSVGRYTYSGGRYTYSEPQTLFTVRRLNNRANSRRNTSVSTAKPNAHSFSTPELNSASRSSAKSLLFTPPRKHGTRFRIPTCSIICDSYALARF
jgi:hypothetical protein